MSPKFFFLVNVIASLSAEADKYLSCDEYANVLPLFSSCFLFYQNFFALPFYIHLHRKSTSDVCLASWLAGCPCLSLLHYPLYAFPMRSSALSLCGTTLWDFKHTCWHANKHLKGSIILPLALRVLTSVCDISLQESWFIARTPEHELFPFVAGCFFI